VASIDEKIKTLKDSIQETTETNERLAKEMGEWNSDYKEHGAEIKRLESELAELEAKRFEAGKEVQQRKQAIQNGEHEIANWRTILKETRREKSIQELLAKQIPFWEAAEERLAVLMKDLNDGLEGFDDNTKDSKDVIQNLIKEKENPRVFSNRTIATNGAINFYQQNLRQLCEWRVDGKQITPAQKTERLKILNRYFQSPEVIPLWS